MAARVRNWGRWGPEDEIGTLNLIDEAARRRARRPWSRGGPSPWGCRLSEAEGIQLGFVEGRVNPTRTMVQVNQPVNADQPDWVCFSEDVLTLATQCATHWDALAHGSYGGVIYNGYPASTVSADGAARCGIHRLGAVVSRGVLLDVARALGLRRARAGLSDHAGGPRRGVGLAGCAAGAGRHRAGADGPDGAPGSRAARPGRLHLALAGTDHRDGRVVPPTTTWPQWPPTPWCSRSTRASTRTPTCPCISCTWWRWA